VQSLSFSDARASVIREVLAGRIPPAEETILIEDSPGRVLAESVPADRDYPPFNRAMRDGFAVRTLDTPGRLRVIGEVRAGERFRSYLRSGEAIEIMTGAPVPDGADSVVMVEHTTRHDDRTVEIPHSVTSGFNIAPAASEAREGTPVLHAGDRIDYSSVAWLATTGHSFVSVFARPRVAILATGDEIIAINDTPASHQIRNSNSYSLAAQVRRAGGEPYILPVARDDKVATAHLIAQGLEADLLLLSGGVSAGKYDFVEAVLGEFGAEFFFDRVLIQPGQPLVFGRARDKFFFGLPGNPASTMVTFELFARAALQLLSGASKAPLPLTLARLTCPFHHKTGLTRFLPAWVCTKEPSCAEITPVDWQGSGDVPSLCRANAFLVADSGQADYSAGDLIRVLLK
jgi:molybdopterin molybdotransferase